jgi:hypothetical protein
VELSFLGPRQNRSKTFRKKGSAELIHKIKKLEARSAINRKNFLQ